MATNDRGTAATETTVSALVSRLKQHGIAQAFGIPGTHNIPVYRELARLEIPHVAPHHEQGAGYAADGYARSSGRPALCLVTTGPGVTNVMTAAANAQADSIPMLIVAPGLPLARQGRQTGDLHDSRDQFGAMASLVSCAERLCTPLDACAAVDRAFASFSAGRPFPVYFELPIDCMDHPGEVNYAEPAQVRPSPPDAEGLRKAADLLNRASSVTMVLGGGASGAADLALEVAERLGCAVVTTIAGKGTVPDDHPLNLGATLRLQSTRSHMADSDVVLAVGTELSASVLWADTPYPVRGSLIRIDIDPGQLNKNGAATVAIVSDAEDAFQSLLPLLTEPAATAQTVVDEVRSRAVREGDVDASPYRDYLAALQGCLTDEAVVVGDQAQACYYGAAQFVNRGHPRQFLMPTGYATLGYALPAAIGAKLAAPERNVLALSGDGGFLFTMQELATAVAETLAIPIVIFNNGGYGEIHRNMMDAGIEPAAVLFEAPDFVVLAESFGARGERAVSAKHLARLVDHAFSEDGPTVIEVKVPGPATTRGISPAANSAKSQARGGRHIDAA